MSQGAIKTADELYEECVAEYGAALERLASGYERDADLRRDLIQDIHGALWRSLRIYDGRCSLRTWSFRVAHNVATSYVVRRARHSVHEWLSIDAAESFAAGDDAEDAANTRLALERVKALILDLKPLDRQVILLYLEGFDAISVAEVTGLSAASATSKVHRIKQILTRRFHEGGTRDAGRRTIARHSSAVEGAAGTDDDVDIRVASPVRAEA